MIVLKSIKNCYNTSLRIAADTIETLSTETFERTYLAEFLRICSKLCERQDRSLGHYYFLKQFINRLDFATIEFLLDDLTQDLACTCRKEPYECDCRNGISKIVGSMLDRYFELATPPFDPLRVWQWVENLVFHEQKGTDRSKSVQVLQEDNALRQGIIAHVFGQLTDRDDIFKTRINKFEGHSYSHTGLNFRRDDDKFIVDLAFETDNPALWVSFMAGHQYYRDKEKRGPDNLRRHMREQALEKPLFMREWAKANRAAQRVQPENRMRRVRRTRKIERLNRRQYKIRAANIKYVQDNRELVEGGRHWTCLVRFAELVLNDPDKIEQKFGDEVLVRNALRNCLDFIAPHVPDLNELAELHCASKYHLSVKVLYAACLEIMRVEGNLERVDCHLLRSLRTHMNISHSAVSGEERTTLLKEIDRLIFTNSDSAEDFLRQYLEPQLEQSGCAHVEVELLRNEDSFSYLRATLSLEWLQRFRELELMPLNRLFEIAAQYGDRDNLKEIISERCVEYMSAWPNPTKDEDIEQKRAFWLVRAWYFLDVVPETYCDWLTADRDTLLIFHELSGRMSPRDHSYWPKLTSSKVEAILDAFIDQWPKVYLPDYWGTDSPKEENAYRFLTEVIWSISSDDPADAIPALERLLVDPRFTDLHNDLKSIHASQVRKKALRDFEPPTPQEIVNQLDRDEVVTVESLRQLVIQELQDFQKAIDGGEFNSADRFYEKGDRLGEVRSTEIIAERLNLRLEPQGISVTPEHQLKDANRSDFTVTKMIGGKRRLLVTEVKGQWHSELYTAASAQLHERYSIHPDAEQQGIFIVIWFGADEEVAGRKRHDIGSAQELRMSIEASLTPALRGLIDMFVLDVSKPK